MDFGELIPIAGIVGGTVMFVSALRFVRDRQTQQAAVPEGAQENEKLANENAALRGTVGRLEERIAVLERIATDPAERTAREIEQLR
jgi:hypothetical protein